jgi:hypothetical protein
VGRDRAFSKRERREDLALREEEEVKGSGEGEREEELRERARG